MTIQTKDKTKKKKIFWAVVRNAVLSSKGYYDTEEEMEMAIKEGKIVWDVVDDSEYEIHDTGEDER